MTIRRSLVVLAVPDLARSGAFRAFGGLGAIRGPHLHQSQR